MSCKDVRGEGRPAQGLAVKGGQRRGGRRGREKEVAGVYRASVGVWSAELQMLGRRALVWKEGSAQQQGGHCMTPVGAVKAVN